MRMVARVICVATLATCCGVSIARLPPPSEDAKAKSAEAAAKAAWTDKVGLYKTCLAMDRVAETYQRDAKKEAKQVSAPIPTPPCADPGPYSSQVTPVTSKPIEASGAHSPPGSATSPPSTNTPAAVMPAGPK